MPPDRAGECEGGEGEDHHRDRPVHEVAEVAVGEDDGLAEGELEARAEDESDDEGHEGKPECPHQVADDGKADDQRQAEGAGGQEGAGETDETDRRKYH